MSDDDDLAEAYAFTESAEFRRLVESPAFLERAAEFEARFNAGEFLTVEKIAAILGLRIDVARIVLADWLHDLATGELQPEPVH